MLKKQKYNLIMAAMTYAITLIISIAMFLPENVGNILDINLPADATYGVNEIDEEIGCTVEADGTYTILKPDPQLKFSIYDDVIECIKLTVVSASEQNIPFEIYTAFADGQFLTERCYSGNILAGEQSAVIDIPRGKYSFLRVDIDQINVKFESIEVFDEHPTQIPYNPKFPIWHYLIVFILPLSAACAMWGINKHFKVCERIIEWFLKNRIKVLTVAVFAVVALLVAILVELLICIFIGEESFNVYRWLILVGATELIVVFVFGGKSLKVKPENVFLPVALILGAVMLFGSPIKHICWDLDSHYPWAVQASYPGTTYVTAAYNNIDYALQQSLVLDMDSYDEDIELLSQADEIFVSETDSEFSITHLPAGIFMAVARLFGAGFEVKYNLGRLAYLLVYAIVCYFAIRKIKSGKMILATICLFPTNLFLATNYTYDWWVTAFCILGTSYFVSELQQPNKPISVKDTLIMGLAFAIGSLPKLVYIILMGMTLFMRKNWRSKKEKQKYYGILVAIFAFVFVLFILRSMASIGGTGDSRGGAVNPSAQLSGILSAPFDYAKLLFEFLASYLSIGTMKDYISNFAYLGMGSYWIVFAVVLGVVALTDSTDKVIFKTPLYMKILSILLLVGMSALIATAMYISFTPVGTQTINGCQPRYIIPLLAPLLLLVTGRRFNLFKNKSVYNGCILGILSVTVLIETYMQIVKIMI